MGFAVALFFTRPECQHWIRELDGIAVPQTTMSDWLRWGAPASGGAGALVQASLRWVDKPARSGWAARGPGNACRFTVDDFQQLRLVAQFRYRLRLTLPEIDACLKTLGPQLQAVLRNKADAFLVLDPATRRPELVSARDGSRLDVRTAQYLLPLQRLTIGNEEAARRSRQIAA